MITEDYCSYEVAKLLKEKGFLKDVDLRMTQNLSFYDNIGLHHNLNKWYDSLIQDKIDFIVAPTHQMAMKWLREVHNIFIVIEPHMYDYINEKNSSYVTSLWQGDNYYENITSKDYPAYEEAVEAAIKYSLENLI
jgi:hypothetical protein